LLIPGHMKKQKTKKTAADSLSYTQQVRWNKEEKAFWSKYFNNPPAPEDIPPHIDHLRLGSGDINDGEIGFLVGRIKSIGMLDLDDALISNEAIRQLTRLEHIGELRLKGCTELDNGCVGWLTQLRGLQLLHLVDTNITIDGLTNLQPLQELGKLFLSVDRNKDIAAKMRELQEQLPTCNFYINYTLYEVEETK
jgi:hypothetical protein